MSIGVKIRQLREIKKMSQNRLVLVTENKGQVSCENFTINKKFRNFFKKNFNHIKTSIL